MKLNDEHNPLLINQLFWLHSSQIASQLFVISDRITI